MSKTDKIRGFLCQCDLGQYFDIWEIQTGLAHNFLLLVEEQRKYGFDLRSAATMTAIMLTPSLDDLKSWVVQHGSSPLDHLSQKTIKEKVAQHMSTGVFSEHEAIEMAFQKALWSRLIRLYESYRIWKHQHLSVGEVV